MQHAPRTASSLKTHTLGLMALATLGLMAAPAANAQTTLGGSYNNQAGDGYDAVSGQTYTVLPTATFDRNGNSGLSADGATVNILGGDFSHNGFAGVYTSFGSNINISGGSFNDNFSGVEAFSSIVNITGGDFTGNSNLSLISYGSNITLFGDFSSYGLVPDAATFNPSSFSGRLQNNTTSQTFTYGELNGGTITLAPSAAPVPEASTTVSLGLLLVLGGLAFAVRRRKNAAAA